jgi:hypothetical protein
VKEKAFVALLFLVACTETWLMIYAFEVWK